MRVTMVPLLAAVVEAAYVSYCFATARGAMGLLFILLGMAYLILPLLFRVPLLPNMRAFSNYFTLGGVLGALYGRKALR